MEFTQQNLTAGVAATRSLLSVSSPLTPLDTIISAFSLSTPHGRTIAYTAVYEGTSLATLNSTRTFPGDENRKGTGLSYLSNTYLIVMQFDWMRPARSKTSTLYLPFQSHLQPSSSSSRSM